MVGNCSRIAALVAAAGICAGGQRTSSPEPPVPLFRTGTRLVEVEVVVRDKKGAVMGLTRDDFTLFDKGKPQQIAVFNDSASRAFAAKTYLPVVKGAVSNRIDRTGRAINGATVLLFDQLNTSFEHLDYARSQLLKYLESAGDGEQVAIYMLGKGLSIIQDFTDDPETLRQAVRKWDNKNLLLLIQSEENMDSVDLDAAAMSQELYQRMRNQLTAEAVAKITQHLAGMPGRKNLVWLSDTPGGPGSLALGAANIHLYPVLVRGVGSSGVIAWVNNSRAMGPGFATRPMPLGADIARERANAAAAALSGGTGFSDSRDIALAIHTAVEDAGSAYILGFYPAEEALDNKFHNLLVNVGKKGEARSRTIEVRYRPGYFASREGGLAAPPSSVDSLLRNPLDATGIGITALPRVAGGKYVVTLTVDLHDVHFEMRNNQHVGSLALSVADDASRKVETHTLQLSFTDAQFAGMLEHGFSMNMEMEDKSPVRLVAQDPATGAAGSVRVAPAKD
jgi:VWFA-related protein